MITINRLEFDDIVINVCTEDSPEMVGFKTHAAILKHRTYIDGEYTILGTQVKSITKDDKTE